MPAGRPSSYRPEMVDQVYDYLKTYKEEHGHLLPTQEGLSEVLGVTVRTIQNWCEQEDKQDFFRALETLASRQKRMLIEKGLEGDWNSPIVKLGLSANHGMHEKQEREVSFDPSNMSIPELMAEFRELTGQTP